ncbi:MAG: hypothetical protein ACYTG1_02955 [Planctomycetota bacterium]
MTAADTTKLAHAFAVAASWLALASCLGYPFRIRALAEWVDPYGQFLDASQVAAWSLSVFAFVFATLAWYNGARLFRGRVLFAIIIGVVGVAFFGKGVLDLGVDILARHVSV